MSLTSHTRREQSPTIRLKVGLWILIMGASLGSPLSHAYLISVNAAAGVLGDTTGRRVEEFEESGGATSASVQAINATKPGVNARAAVDLASGELRAFATSITQGINHISGASARLQDELLFSLPDGMDSASVTLSLLVEGIVDGRTTQRSAVPQQLRISRFEQPDGRNGLAIPAFQLFDSTMFSLRDLINDNPGITNVSETLSLTWDVFDGDLFRFNASIETVVEGASTLDFSNTGTLSLDLPMGATFTSASGVFLNDAGGGGPPVSQIPTPATGSLALLGSLVLLSRRHLAKR